MARFVCNLGETAAAHRTNCRNKEQPILVKKTITLLVFPRISLGSSTYRIYSSVSQLKIRTEQLKRPRATQTNRLKLKPLRNTTGSRWRLTSPSQGLPCAAGSRHRHPSPPPRPDTPTSQHHQQGTPDNG